MGCEENSDLETPHFKTSLVIHCFISPSDTVIQVHVGTTKNLYGKLNNYPGNLPVKITMVDAGHIVEFTAMDTAGFCKAKYPIIADHEYTIIAKCEGYPEASATCKVPALKDFTLSVDTISTYTHNDWGDYLKYWATIKFKDKLNEANFYNMTASIYLSDQYGEHTYQFHPVLNGKDGEWDSNLVFSDHLIDGQEILHNYEFSFYANQQIYLREIIANVFETDESYFKYHKSLQTYSGTDQPFTEYSPIYTNVNGGYGIFASYVKYEKTLKLK